MPKPSGGPHRGIVDASVTLLRELGVKDGQWTFNTKAQWIALMECPPGQALGYLLVTLPVRVLACVMLHSYGRLPGSAGIESKATRADVQAHHVCQLHGGVIARRPISKGRFVPITSANICGELNEAVLAPFERDGAPLTPELAAPLLVKLAEVRRALQTLEDLGFILRCDNFGTPLREVGGDESDISYDKKGRPFSKALRKLRDKTSIVVYAQPKAPTGEFSTSRQRSTLAAKAERAAAKQDLAAPEPELVEQLCFDFFAICGLGDSLSTEQKAEFARRDGVAKRLLDIRRQEEALAEERQRLQDEIRAFETEKLQGKLFEATAAATSSPVPIATSADQRSPSTLSAKSTPASEPVSSTHGAGRVVEAHPGSSPDQLQVFKDSNRRASSASSVAGSIQGSARQEATPLVSQPRKKGPATDAELRPLRTAITEMAGRADMQLVKHTYGMARDYCPDCTVEEVTAIALEAGERMKKISGIRNRPKYLSEAVIKEFEGGIAEWRKQRAQAQRKPAAIEHQRCPECGDVGLIGAKSVPQLPGEYVAEVRAGATFCFCAYGHQAREHCREMKRSAS